MKLVPQESALIAVLILLSGCAYQAVRFETTPDCADLYINGNPQGKAPVTVELVTDSFGNLHPAHQKYTITARMDGYEDETLVLESPCYFFNNTKPFPATIQLRLRKTGEGALAMPGPSQPFLPGPKQSTPALELPLETVAPF